MRFYNSVSSVVVYTEDGSNAQGVDLSRFDHEFVTSTHLPQRRDGKLHSEPSKIELTVYSLDDDMRSTLSASSKGIEISFGYDGESSVLFRGPIVNVYHEPYKIAWKTVISGSAAWNELSVSKFGKAYSAGTPVATVVMDVAKSFGLPVIMKASITSTLLTGSGFDGLSKTVLDRLCRDYDLAWSVKPEGVEIIDTLNPPLVEMNRLVVLGSELTSLPIVEESLEKKKNKETVTRRIRATSLLHPELRAGVPVRFNPPGFSRSFAEIATVALPDLDLKSNYVCDSVVHRGGNTASQSTSEIVTKEESL